MVEWGKQHGQHVLNTKGISAETKTIIKYQMEILEIKNKK